MGRDISGTTFSRAELFRGDFVLGAKQEGLTIVHFLNKLIVSCKEAVVYGFLSIFVCLLFLNWIVIFYSN